MGQTVPKDAKGPKGTPRKGLGDLARDQVQELEQQARQLPDEQPLWLIERLVPHLRARPPAGPAPADSALAHMAADPEIQWVLHAIERATPEGEATGLRLDSVFRADQVTTVARNTMYPVLGVWADMQSVDVALCHTLAL